MRHLFVMAIFCFGTVHAFAQIEGRWKTFNEKTKKAESIIEIFKKQDGKFYGKIVHLLVEGGNGNCMACVDDRKGKPMIGLEIIRGLEKDGNEYSGGRIMDPESGDEYKCIIKRDGKYLKVRGYVGFAAMGRTQVWESAD